MSQQQPAHATPLPGAVTDHGDRLEVRPVRGAERMIRGSIAVLLVVVGASLAILAPADLADNPLARFGFSGALVLAGLVSLAGATRRLEVDTSGITQHGVLGSRTIPSPQVAEIELHEHSDRTSPTFSRRVGRVRIGLGGGRGRSTFLGVFSRRRWVVSMRIGSRGGHRDITLGLRDAQLGEAEELVEEMRERASLPDDLTVEVRSDRSRDSAS